VVGARCVRYSRNLSHNTRHAPSGHCPASARVHHTTHYQIPQDLSHTPLTSARPRGRGWTVAPDQTGATSWSTSRSTRGEGPGGGRTSGCSSFSGGGRSRASLAGSVGSYGPLRRQPAKPRRGDRVRKGAEEQVCLGSSEQRGAATGSGSWEGSLARPSKQWQTSRLMT